MSKLSDRGNRHDRFHRQARKDGYKARAAYKLEAVDQKVRLLGRGNRVLDLGCSPGSWLQYASGRIGPKGQLVGLDRGPIELTLPNLRVEVGDVLEIDPQVLVGDLGAFDVVMSDMAPDTSGVRTLDQDRSEGLFERALDIAEATLDPGGNFVGKIFQGGGFQDLLKRCRREFDKAKVIKPPSSRTASIEQYIVGLGYRGTR